MDRDEFETALDELIEAHGRMVRAGIDAAACRTQTDWMRSHEAADAYLEARDAFLAKVFVPPPDAHLIPSRDAPAEAQERRRTRRTTARSHPISK